MLEHKGKATIIAAVAVTLLLCADRALSAVQLEKYVARVGISSPQAADVSVSVSVKGRATTANSESLLCRLVKYPQQEIDKLQAEDSNGRVLPVTMLSLDGAVEARLPAGYEVPTQYSVRYSVTSPRQLRRIPLAVVDVPPSASEGAIEIQTALASDYVSVGTSFPAMEWRDHQHGSTHLGSVPSVVVLNVKHIRDVSSFDRLFDVSTISTLLMFSFVLISSFVWYLRSR